MMLYVKYVTFYKVSIKLSDYKQTIKMFCKIYRRKIALNFLRLLSFVSKFTGERYEQRDCTIPLFTSNSSEKLKDKN